VYTAIILAIDGSETQQRTRSQWRDNAFYWRQIRRSWVDESAFRCCLYGAAFDVCSWRTSCPFPQILRTRTRSNNSETV